MEIPYVLYASPNQTVFDFRSQQHDSFAISFHLGHYGLFFGIHRWQLPDLSRDTV